MASTRNRNTQGDYKLEKAAYIKTCDWRTNMVYGVPETNYFPGNGIAGAKMARTELSGNYCEIESSLFGIGSTNLENPQPNTVPDIKRHKSLNFGDRIPIYMPRPLEVDTTIQRPMYLN